MRDDVALLAGTETLGPSGLRRHRTTLSCPLKTDIDTTAGERAQMYVSLTGKAQGGDETVPHRCHTEPFRLLFYNVFFPSRVLLRLIEKKKKVHELH